MTKQTTVVVIGSSRVNWLCHSVVDNCSDINGVFGTLFFCYVDTEYLNILCLFQVEQLADHTGEESVILTASVSDGSLSHLGSESGKVFLNDHDDIKSQFLGFCLKSMLYLTLLHTFPDTKIFCIVCIAWQTHRDHVFLALASSVSYCHQCHTVISVILPVSAQ